MLLRGLTAYLEGDLDTAEDVWAAASVRHPEEPRVEIYRSMLARRRSGLEDPREISVADVMRGDAGTRIDAPSGTMIEAGGEPHR